MMPSAMSSRNSKQKLKHRRSTPRNKIFSCQTDPAQPSPIISLYKHDGFMNEKNIFPTLPLAFISIRDNQHPCTTNRMYI